LDLFDSSGNILSNITSLINTAAGVNLDSGVYLGSENLAQVKAETRTVTTSTPSYSSGNVTISSVTYSGGNGAIYWGLSTSSASTPSVEQLFNCQDGSGAALLDCNRQILLNNQTASEVLMSASGSSTYNVYYVPRNDYPFRPVNTSGVITLTASVPTTWGFRAIAMIALLMVALLM
jgi:hypothetical protein